ncbi:MAG: glucoamylase family protein [Acidobacteriota bacterium]
MSRIGGGLIPAPDVSGGPRGLRRATALFVLVFCGALSGARCGRVASAPPSPTLASSVVDGLRPLDPAATPALDDLERRTFDFFWERANPKNGLVPDRWPSPSFSSIAAVGFALTAYPIGAERGYVSREAARDRVLTTLRFFAAPSGGAAGQHGFFYHFLDMDSGARFKDVELSTIDTTIFLTGALVCQSWFDRADPGEVEIRDLADRLYRAADWTWAQKKAPLVSMGWTPESGMSDWDWRGYNEAMILYVLALGSPDHPVAPAAWEEYTRTYEWKTFAGQQYVAFAPLFGYQYSHVWIDFRGIRDAYMRDKGIDYFENSRRATYAHRQYSIENPGGWRGYGPDVWGLSACDGPIDGDHVVDGRPRHFYTYAARGASAKEIRDDGTITPAAAVSSLPFAPEIVLPAIVAMKARGEPLYARYGFLDAFNPTFRLDIPVQHGRVVPGAGWFDTDYLGIDQGPILAMVENARTDLVWKTLRKNPYVVSGLRRAGFTGGWLDNAAR